MMQLARRFSRSLTARAPRGAAVRADFRAERAAATQPTPLTDYGYSGAYLSPFGSPNPFWQPHTKFAGFIDGGFIAAQNRCFPQL
jgi:hypothetical protein